jgi:hypothetical protein
MKKILLIILTLFLTENTYCQEPLQVFNEILGKDQALAFDQAVISFEKFLKINYPDQHSRVEQNSQFLKDFQSLYASGRPEWNFPDDNQTVLNQWEESGLRKEIRLWTNEKYFPYHLPDLGVYDSTGTFHFEIEEEIIPIPHRDGQTVTEPMERDSFLISNTMGKYLYALDQCCSYDPIIYEYLDAMRMAGDISPSLMAGAFSTFGERLSDPIVLRMIVAELYYWIMISELEKEK